MQRPCTSFIKKYLKAEINLWPLENLHVEYASEKVVQKRTGVLTCLRKTVARMVSHCDAPCIVAIVWPERQVLL